jgi:carbon monoxide dehydrogenase subunit G
MQIDNSFEVPLPPGEAWKVLLDIERIAPCMPGAELTEIVDERNYKGKVSVRLGPVALAFAGQVQFEDIDDDNHKARAKAKGKDSKGRGGANAIIVFNLEPAGAGSTVFVSTDLNLSGSIAQYGRASGMIEGVATALIGQFADNLKAQLEASDSTEPGSAAGAAEATRPISGFSLILKGLWNAILGLFGRSPGAGR